MAYKMDPRISRHYLEITAKNSNEIVTRGFNPTGTGGDVSLRDPVTGLIYISGTLRSIPYMYTNLSEFRAQDISVYELDGTNITPWSISTIETPMHLAIYRARPDVNAIVHSHPDWSSVFGIIREDIPLALAEEFINLGGDIGVAEYAPAGAMEMGDYIVEALGSRNAALMANHGAVAVGPSFEEAWKNAYYLEKDAQKIIFAKLLGEITTLDPSTIKAAKFMEGTYIPEKKEESNE